MTDVTASRTLVKSPPELWTECSNAESLARHLDRFGEIRITRLEPETAVAWEGEHASGTVKLEPSGWGTRVVLTATPAPAPESASAEVAEPASAPEPALSQVAEPASAPEAATESPLPAASQQPQRGLIARLGRIFERGRSEPAAGEVAAPETSNTPEPIATLTTEPGTSPPPDPQEILAAALNSLGQAHHRPFSRA